MKIACIWVFISIGWQILPAQNFAVIRPLEAELENCKDTERRVRIHLNLLDEYEVFDIGKSIEHGLDAWNEASKDSLKKEMATAAYHLGSIYQFDDVRRDKAIEWYFNALDLSEQIKDSTRISDCLYNIGLLDCENGEVERGLKHLTAAAKIAALRNDFTMIVMAEVAIGNKVRPKSEQLKHYQQALYYATQTANDTVSLAQVWSTLGQYYLELKDTTLSKVYYEKVFRLLQAANLASSDHYLLELFATACLRTGRYDEAIQVAGRIVSVRNNPGASEWYSIEGMKLLAESYFYNGYDSLAFWTVMEYAAKKDSLWEIRNNSRAQRNTQRLQAEFDAKKREQELKLLQATRKYERYFGYILVVGILLCMLFAASLYRKRQQAYSQNKQLARLNQTKDKLLSIISHDVRSPIQALQNIISLFEQDIATKEDVYNVTKHVSTSVQSMAQGLDNLFYWAQSQQQELNAYPESFNLADLVFNLLTLFEERIRVKELTITNTLREPVYIVSDILHCRLIISNILVNAIKFSPPGGIIKIDFQFDAESNGVLSITDSGQGIPPEDIAKIFDPTIRYTRTGTKGEPGSGLGLSLTRDLLHLDNNEIQIDSYPGQGTRVNVIFKRKNPLRSSSGILPSS